jgi:hypothetical protein
MGTYLSIPLYLRNTVTLEPIAKKADTGAVQSSIFSASSELQNVTKVMETTGLIENKAEVYIKNEPKVEPKVELKVEPKMVFLTITEPSKKVDLMEEENVILLSSTELKERIIGMADEQLEQKKEKVRTFHKKTCTELLQKVKCYEHPASDDEDSVPLSRQELRNHVLRELENNSKKVNMNIKEKTVHEYLKEMSKEKLKTPPLKPLKEESLQDIHPFLLEYGVNPIKTNTIMIDNRMYHKIDVPNVPVAPVAPNPSNKKNKRKKH